MPATTCVHCGKVANIKYFPKSNEWTDPLLSWISTSLHQWLGSNANSIVQLVNELDSRLRLPVPEGNPEKWRIGLCEGCQRPLFLVLDYNETTILRTFPPVSLERPADVPEGVAADYVEASLCLSVGAHKAAAAMCRRALQAAALDKGCKRRKLNSQLDELSKKGLLNPSLLEVAHQVRYFGNYGAHPDEDGLGGVSQDEADTIHKLTWQVLEDLYVNPARVGAMKAALAGKKPQPGSTVQAPTEEPDASADSPG
jgi:hypothetical protein